MNYKKKLNKAIKSAREENQKVFLLIDKLKSVSSKKNDNFAYDDIIFTYIVIVLEHHRSIIELTNIRQISALALVRPLYEAYIRTHWLSTRAGSLKANKAAKQLINDVKDGAFPTLKEMCNDIDKWYNHINSILNMNNQNRFSRELELNKNIYHSYTHGGAYLISVINNSNDKYTYEDMINLLEDINIFMFSATLEYASITGNKILFNKIRAVMNAQS